MLLSCSQFLFNPQKILFHFFQDVTLDLSMSIYRRYLVYATAHTVYTVLLETLHVFMSWPEDITALRIKFSD